MIEILAITAAFLGFTLVVRLVATVGAGSSDPLDAALAFRSMPDRPRGMQEIDLPPFRLGGPAAMVGSVTSGSVALAPTFAAGAA